ncbi:MAG: DUF3486 family protein [Rudaea sp.]|uniref:phage protein Gp27 family protein n=1 Tax=unclassified Rudaea TaxID=2627037 RepID=UPI0010F796C6|nr:MULTISPECIES: phage protein Gp27 family protein [unclassified Rudaea]MBN8885915.1 DUF3486 family protein [Rudaea sp.]MBR0346988.1 DUF3486 family protein [Rudaea sp.]
MAARSSVARLPQELVDLCNRLMREGKTIYEITDKLNELDADVSKSAVGRYVKSAREQMQRYRDAQQVASQWVEQLGENGRGDVATLCQQMLTGIAFQTLDQVATAQLQEAGDDSTPAKPLKAMDLMLLAKALESIEASSKRSMERREKIERLALERQAKAAEKTARANGLSDDQWEAIRKKFLGIRDDDEGVAA